MPSATASQVSANVISASSAGRREPVERRRRSARKPTSSATPITTARLSSVWIRLPSTWPVSTEAREMAMVRKRAMMPSVMSMATEIAVPWAAPATVISRIPGVT